MRGNTDSPDGYESDIGLRRLIGRRPWEVSSGGMDSARWAPHRARLEVHEPFRDFEVVRTGPDGEMQTVSGEPVFDADGRFTGYRGVGRSITEQRRSQVVCQELEGTRRPTTR